MKFLDSRMIRPPILNIIRKAKKIDGEYNLAALNILIPNNEMISNKLIN